MSNVAQTLRGGIIGRTGSFYASDLDARSKRQAHALSSGVMVAPLSLVSRIAVVGAGEGVTAANTMSFAWDEDNLAVIGQNHTVMSHSGAPVPGLRVWAGKLAADLLDALTERYGDGTDGLSLFAVRLPSGIRPLTLVGTSGTLTAGVDFDVHESMLVFRSSPFLEFPLRRIHVLSGHVDCGVPMSYAAENPPGVLSSGTMRYHRAAQSLENLRVAAAEAAGLIVKRGADVVIGAVAEGAGMIYATSSGATLRVPYAHKPLQVGELVADGHVFTDYRTEAQPYQTGFGIRVAVSPADFSGQAWDFSFINATLGVVAASNVNFDLIVGDVCTIYGGVILLVFPGATVDASPIMRQRLIAFLRRHRPAHTVFAIHTP